MGALIPLLLLTLLGYLSYSSRSRYEQVEPPSGTSKNKDAKAQPTAAARAGGLTDASFWSGRQPHARLSRLHLAAGVAVVSLLLQHCVALSVEAGGAAVEARLLGLCASVVQLVVLLTALGLLFDVPRRQAPSVVILGVAIGALMLTAAFAVLQPEVSTQRSGTTPGIRFGINVGWRFIAGCMLLLFVIVVAQQIRRVRAGGTQSRPSSLKSFDGWPCRPFSWGAPFVLPVVGLLLFHGIFLAVLVWVVDVLLSAPDTAGRALIELPPAVRVVMSYIIFGGLGVFTLYVVVLLGWWLRSGTRATVHKFVLDVTRPSPAGPGDAGDYVPADVSHIPRRIRPWLVTASTQEFPPRGSWWRSAGQRRLDTDPVKKPTLWSRRRSRWNFLAGGGRTICYFLTGLVAGAVVIALVVWTQFLITGTIPAGLWVGLAAKIGILIPPAVIGFMAVTWRQPERRRVLGTIWDVGTFWPRSFHPFAPPCYSERAVPELIRRIWWLHDNDGRAVLAAHSQGSVIALAAVLRSSPRRHEPAVGLVTFGSPLLKLYTWAFPAYLPSSMFDLTAAGKAGIGTVLWRNVFYPTDYIGGPVNARPLIDVRFPDPASDVFVYGQPPPKVLTHTGYWVDSRLWEQVDVVVSDLTAAE